MKHRSAVKMKSKRGQSSVEYILIIAAVVGVIFMFGGKFKDGVKGVTEKLFGNIEKSVNGLSGGGG